jgi:hypothetical protein
VRTGTALVLIALVVLVYLAWSGGVLCTEFAWGCPGGRLGTAFVTQPPADFFLQAITGKLR